MDTESKTITQEDEVKQINESNATKENENQESQQPEIVEETKKEPKAIEPVSWGEMDLESMLKKANKKKKIVAKETVYIAPKQQKQKVEKVDLRMKLTDKIDFSKTNF